MGFSFGETISSAGAKQKTLRPNSWYYRMDLEDQVITVANYFPTRWRANKTHGLVRFAFRCSKNIERSRGVTSRDCDLPTDQAPTL